MDLTCLKESGLTEGEIKVYLALLELGSSTTGPLVHKSGVSRSIIYAILERLMQKGLVSYISQEKIRYYQAAEPDKILEYLQERENALKQNKALVKELLPYLRFKQKLVPKNEANFYLGFQGIRTAHEHIYLKLKCGEEYCYLGIPTYQPEEQHRYWQKDHFRRTKLGIRCKILFNKDADPAVLTNRNSYKGCDARYMPSDVITPACLGIYKDVALIFIQHPEALAVEIINQQIADSFKAYFDEFWKKSKPFIPSQNSSRRSRTSG